MAPSVTFHSVLVRVHSIILGMLDWLERLGRLPPEVWLIPPAVIVAFLVGIGLARHRARLRRYRAIAARTGLSVKPGIVNPSQVHGSYRGRTLVMTTASARPTWFSWRRTWTLVTVNLMRLDKITSGDREFDRRYLVLSRDAGAVTRILSDPSLRNSLLHADVNTVRLYHASAQVFYARDERNPEHAERLFDASVHLADAVDAIRYP